MQKEPLENVLLSSIESLSSKYNLTKDTFTAWYASLISKVEERISHVMIKLKFQQTKPILQDKEVLDCLNDLREKFNVVVNVKTSNNVAIFLKNMSKNYFLRLAYLMIALIHTSFQTNVLVMLFLIIFCFVKALSVFLKQEEHNSSPFMYWILKLHYTYS